MIPWFTVTESYPSYLIPWAVFIILNGLRDFFQDRRKKIIDD